MSLRRYLVCAGIVAACPCCALAFDGDAFSRGGSGGDATTAEDVSAEAAREEAGTTDSTPPLDAGRVDAAIPEGAVTWTNGHVYALVVTPEGITWDAARAEAAALGGHLATITSKDENAFVSDLARSDRAAWKLNISGPWLGGYQVAGSDEPAGGWRWVTDEPFTLRVWAFGEPNNGTGASENHLHYFPLVPEGTWNDTESIALINGYLVEFE